jgi:uncharacterized integral membrane protein (TIGR00697 family)
MVKIQKLDLLISLYMFCIAVSELMGLKTFPLFHLGSFQLNASVGIFVIPVIYSINDVITEVHGKERARSIVRSGLVVVALFLLTSLVFTSLPPSTRFEATEPAYDAIFRTSARIAFASLTAFAVAEYLDVFIFVKVRERFGKKALWLRNNLSNFISEFFDTMLFMTLAFYAFDRSINVNVVFLTSLILPYWLLKCALSVIETPFVYVGVSWLKKGE